MKTVAFSGMKGSCGAPTAPGLTHQEDCAWAASMPVGPGDEQSVWEGLSPGAPRAWDAQSPTSHCQASEQP